MADITLPTTAVPSDGAQSVPGTAGATIAQGQIVYRNTSKRYALANANNGTTAGAVGMVQESATNGAPINIQTGGKVSGLTGLTAGTVYFLSDTVAGAICLAADLTTGARVIIVGYATSTTELVLLMVNTGVTL